MSLKAWMRKQQSNYKGTKRNSKAGGRQQTDNMSTSTHTYTHTTVYADTWHTMNRSRTSHGAPKGTIMRWEEERGQAVW